MKVSGLIYVVVGLVALARLAELLYARRNTRRLLMRGAREAARGHYPLIVALHAGWLAAMIVWRRPDGYVNVYLLGAFALLQAARLWVLASLGPYWTTRIITLKNAPLVARGPYRFMRHPNYAVVAGEIAILPLAFGEIAVAIVFSILNGFALVWRVRRENEALADRRRLADGDVGIEATNG